MTIKFLTFISANFVFAKIFNWKRIKQLRDEKGISQQELALRCGYEFTTNNKTLTSLRLPEP